MGVTVEAAFGVAVAGLVTGQVPDDEGLVARSGQEHVGAFQINLLVQCSFSLRNNSIFAHFSREVAREVTQPEWPSRVPRRTSCSDIFAEICVLVLIHLTGCLGDSLALLTLN